MLAAVSAAVVFAVTVPPMIELSHLTVAMTVVVEVGWAVILILWVGLQQVYSAPEVLSKSTM